jgi:phosphoglycolate phosphatase
VEDYRFAGRTDPRIVLDLMAGAGLGREEVLRRLPEVEALYAETLERNLDRARMRLLPGVTELLERLAVRSDLEVALLTGNWERGARSKLARFDLNAYFPYGAFGGDGIDREDLPPVAWRRAMERTGETFAPEDTLIIGDSLQDIACAHAHGIPVLAVATGFVSAEALAGAAPDGLVEDLRQASSCVPWL